MPEEVKPSHYDLEITPDFDTLEYRCKQVVKLSISKEVKEISMNSKEIFIYSASCGGQKATGINYDIADTKVTLVFDTPLAVGEASLEIDFKGIINGDMCGFYKSQYTDAEGNKAVMGATQFEAIDARRAFPCWDEPSCKATFKITLIVDQKLTALSNMPEINCSFLKGGKKRVEFDVSCIMSTYLVAWCIGEFDYVQGFTKSNVPMRIYAPPGRASHCRFALDCSIRCLEFYNDFFGIPYPLPKCDMIAITEFAAGAMENYGLITYREVALMVDDDVASAATKQRVAIVIAHELAHQWFGNLTTMQWWNSLWLNEGFAAFMEHFGTDALYPEYHIWEQYTIGAYRHAQMLDGMRSSHPVIVPIKDAKEVEQVFDAISYCKGSSVVRMVNAITGAEAFRTGLQTYFGKYSYSNATTEQLFTEWSAASGKDINKLMSTWTTVKGYPFVKVLKEEWEAAQVTITLEQAWFLQDGSGENDPEAPLWDIPLFFATSQGNSSATAEIMNQKQQSFVIPLGSADDFVKINAGQIALARVAHSVEMSKRLRKGITGGSLSAIDRASLLTDGYALAKAGVASPESMMEILLAFEEESDSNVWSALSSVLEGFNTLSQNVSPECNAAYRQIATRIVGKAFKKVGFDTSEKDSHSLRLLRSTVLGQVGTFMNEDGDVVAECRRRFHAYENDNSSMPTDIQTTILEIVLANGGQSEYDMVMKMYTSTDDMQRKKIPLNVLGHVNDDKLKVATLEWALRSEDVKLQDFFYPIGSVAHDMAGASLSWTFLQDHFEEFMAKVEGANSHLFDAVLQFITVRFMSAEKAAEIEAFFQVNPIPRNTMRLTQMLEYVRANAKFLAAFNSSKLSDPGYYSSL